MYEINDESGSWLEMTDILYKNYVSIVLGGAEYVADRVTVSSIYNVNGRFKDIVYIHTSGVLAVTKVLIGICCEIMNNRSFTSLYLPAYK